MNAIVSGRSGRALIIEGDSLKSFDVNDPSKIVPREQAELPYLFGEAADLRILENTNLESVQRELSEERKFTLALDLALISLDAELAEDIREEALVELDELLGTKKTLEQVENVLYAQELPETADIEGALQLCSLTTTKTSLRFLRRLRTSQPRIAFIRDTWESIPAEMFTSSEHRKDFRSVAVREGFFRDLVLGIPRPGIFFRHAASNRSIENLPNFVQVLREWEKRSLPFYDRSEMAARIRALKQAHANKMKGAQLHRKRKSKEHKRTTDDRRHKTPQEESP